MTEGSPVKNIVSFAIPLISGHLFQQLYNIADSLIVGNYLGNNALAAVSSSGNLIFLMVSFLIGMGSGGGVVISRFFGAHDIKNLRKAIHTAFAFGILAGIALTIIAPLIAPFLLRLIGTPAEVLPQSITYFRLFFLGSIGAVLFNTQMGILQALGDSKHPVMYLGVASVLNVLLDFLLVGILHFGVGGAAIASAITQFLSAILCFRQLLNNPPDFRISLKEVSIHLDLMKQIMHNGVPAGFQNSIIGIANVFVQANINSFGAVAMAACGAYSRIEGFCLIPVLCFADAMVTFVSQNLGAGKKDRVWHGSISGTVISMTMAGTIGGLVILFSPYLLSAFALEQEALAIGIRQSHIAPAFYFLLAFSHSMGGIQRGAGHSMIPMIAMAMTWCVLRVAYISVAVRFIPVIDIVFWAYPLTWAVSSIILGVIFIRRKWLN